MNAVDFLRWMQPSILATLGFLVFIIFVTWMFLKQPEIDDDVKLIVRRIRGFLVAVIFALFFWQIFAAASVNVTPRSVIDRSDVNHQNKQFEKRVTQP